MRKTNKKSPLVSEYKKPGRKPLPQNVDPLSGRSLYDINKPHPSGLLPIQNKEEVLLDENSRLNKERKRNVSSATLKERVRVLPILYKRVSTLVHRISAIDDVMSKVLKHIEHHNLSVINSMDNIPNENKENIENIENGKITEDTKQLNSNNSEDNTSHISIDDLFNFYLEYQRTLNESLEVCRKFLFYFPIEIDAQQRNLLVHFNALSEVQKQRFLLLLDKVLSGEFKLPRPNTPNFQKSVNFFSPYNPNSFALEKTIRLIEELKSVFKNIDWDINQVLPPNNTDTPTEERDDLIDFFP